MAALNETIELSPTGSITAQLSTPSLVKPTGIAVNNRDSTIWSANSNNQQGLNIAGPFDTWQPDRLLAGRNAAFHRKQQPGVPGGEHDPFEPFTPAGLAIDASGNVWITGINFGPNPNQYVTEIIGIAAPILTPTTVQSSRNLYGTRP